MNSEANRLCSDAALSIGGAVQYLIQAMRIDRYRSWVNSDLQRAHDNLSIAMQLVAEAMRHLPDDDTNAP